MRLDYWVRFCETLLQAIVGNSGAQFRGLWHSCIGNVFISIFLFQFILPSAFHFICRCKVITETGSRWFKDNGCAK